MIHMTSRYHQAQIVAESSVCASAAASAYLSQGPHAYVCALTMPAPPARPAAA
eukprot:CAMPEP_0173257324 /NCGR_PEP_ID=MMETSP1142-20121109/23699_1 /TAXON_ID=483371 /ORGANISM="non described non described, Strain CCMP2298" /LENGTH=52 /DNA_ID=CAMNT_0014191425 /DNA_START=1 /DNA_END=156 /DNA_ORIENTATION=+